MPRIPYGIAYLKTDSLLHRTDILDKVVLIGCVFFLSLFIGPVEHLAALYVVVSIIILLTSGASIRKFVTPQLWIAVVFFPLAILVPVLIPLQQAFIYLPPGDIRYLNLFGYLISYSNAGLLYVEIMIFRGMAICVASLGLIWTSHPRNIVYFLTQKLRISYKIAWIVYIALNYTPIIGYESEIIDYANQIRGRKLNTWNPLSRAFFTKWILPITVRGLRRGNATAMAMDCRCYGAYPDRTYRYKPTYSKLSRLVSFLSIILTVLYVLVFFAVMNWNPGYIFRP